MHLRRRLHDILEGNQPNDRTGNAVRRFLVALIVLNVTATVLETVPAVAAYADSHLHWFERGSVVVFALEYLLRLWVAPLGAPDRSPTVARLRWLGSPLALVDLLSVAPACLPWLGVDLRSVRALRLLRILRIARLGRYSQALQTLHNVLRDRAPDLLSLLFLLLAMLVVSATVMYQFEHDAQPQQFSSIPATMWWGIVTLTTIGYGDMSPVTDAGRAFGGVVAVLGIAMFALPAGLLGAAFVEELGKARARAAGPQAPSAACCPHCGKGLHETPAASPRA